MLGPTPVSAAVRVLAHHDLAALPALVSSVLHYVSVHATHPHHKLHPLILLCLYPLSSWVRVCATVTPVFPASECIVLVCGPSESGWVLRGVEGPGAHSRPVPLLRSQAGAVHGSTPRHAGHRRGGGGAGAAACAGTPGYPVRVLPSPVRRGDLQHGHGHAGGRVDELSGFQKWGRRASRGSLYHGPTTSFPGRYPAVGTISSLTCWCGHTFVGVRSALLPYSPQEEWYFIVSSRTRCHKEAHGTKKYSLYSLFHTEPWEHPHWNLRACSRMRNGTSSSCTSLKLALMMSIITSREYTGLPSMTRAPTTNTRGRCCSAPVQLPPPEATHCLHRMRGLAQGGGAPTVQCVPTDPLVGRGVPW